MRAERVARGHRPQIPARKHCMRLAPLAQLQIMLDVALLITDWPEGLHELISACWAQDAFVRPNFAAVVEALNEIQAEGLIDKLDT